MSLGNINQFQGFELSCYISSSYPYGFDLLLTTKPELGNEGARIAVMSQERGRAMRIRVVGVAFAWLWACCFTASASDNGLEPLLRTVDLNVGQEAEVTLCDGSTARIKLLDLNEQRDDLRQAVRTAQVNVLVNGRQVTLTSANYNLPVTVGSVQIDCTVTRGCVQPGKTPWALDADARFRLWPAGSKWIRPGTFACPARQRWFASDT